MDAEKGNNKPISYTTHHGAGAGTGAGVGGSKLRSACFSRRRRRALLLQVFVAGTVLTLVAVLSHSGVRRMTMLSTLRDKVAAAQKAGHLKDVGDRSKDELARHYATLVERPPSDPLKAWGCNSPTPNSLLGDLARWPERAKPMRQDKSLSELGLVADYAYDYGPLAPDTYHDTLSAFARSDAWLPEHAERLAAGLEAYLGRPDGLGQWQTSGSRHAWDDPEHRYIWQTDKDAGTARTESVRTWSEGVAQDEGWKAAMWTDPQAAAFADEFLGSGDNSSEPLSHHLFTSLPLPVMKADLLRYLLLLLRGGIYADTDTQLLKSPRHWGGGAELWKDGEGWMSEEERRRVAHGESADDVLGRPSVVIGIEADVGDREDWNDWWSRPVQIVQWTMALAPYHPIALSAVLRVSHNTARAAAWAGARWEEIRGLRSAGNWDKADALFDTPVTADPADGGPIGVVDWTGPSVWTDAALAYLRTRYNLAWTDLRGLQRPLRVGEVVILPVTGFSPGVGQFGAGETSDNQAMVNHLFRGSWKSGFGNHEDAVQL